MGNIGKAFTGERTDAMKNDMASTGLRRDGGMMPDRAFPNSE